VSGLPGGGSAVVQFVGAGDAFGSGGRFQACISLRTSSSHLLLDCGASSLIALKRLGLDPSSVDAVLISHLHGDHFAGLPFLILDGQFSRRECPLLLAGPPGLAERLRAAQEVLFPGSSSVQRRFEVTVLELEPRCPTAILDALVTAFPVQHPSGAPAYALRLATGGRGLAYSGDSEWCEALAEAAAGVDLFICEAYTATRPVKFHLSYAALREHRAALDCGRIVLTHPGPDLLRHRAELADALADDGLLIEL
jgi:ribonuclease BN (tRNA processing enzyme)